MKYLKTLALAFVLSIFSLSVAQAQSAKLVEKAEAKTEKLNAKLLAAGDEYALTAEQKKEVTELYIGLIKEVRAIKKSDASEEDKKAKQKEANKAVSKKIHSEILTKEQKKAKKTAKQNQ